MNKYFIFLLDIILMFSCSGQEIITEKILFEFPDSLAEETTVDKNKWGFALLQVQDKNKIHININNQHYFDLGVRE